MTTLTGFEAAQMIDHAVLKPQLTYSDKEAEFTLAAENGAWSVCVAPKDIPFASRTLVISGNPHKTKVCAVVGFPNSTGSIRDKVQETLTAMNHGAQEIDYVIDLSAAKSGDWSYVKREAENILATVQMEFGDEGVCKAIFETAYMTDEEIRAVSEIMADAGMPFIKTSTGFAHEGATDRSVSIMCEFITDTTQVKASGGVRDMETLTRFYDMGVRRFGTSNTAAIVNGGTATSDY